MIQRMYTLESKPPRDIARVVKRRLDDVQRYCATLIQRTMPKGEVTIYTDEQGRKITKYPPGYALGYRPAASVRGTGGV